MKMPETLTDIVLNRAAQLEEKIAFTVLRDGIEPSQQINYRELAERSQAIAAELQKRGLARERALLLYPAGIEFLVGFLGCLMAGVIGVPAPPPESTRQKRSGSRLRSIIDDCDARIVLTSSETLPHVTELLSDQRIALATFETQRISVTPASTLPLSMASDSELAYLQYTSGSTSTPKGIEITHKNLVHHLKWLQKTCSYDSDSVTITWMPNFHDWGLVEGLLQPLFNGTPCYILSPFSFVRRPRNWLAAISRFGGTHSQGPSFAYEHCLRRVADDLLADFDLSRWKAAGIAAEPINFQVMQQFFQKFRRCGFSWETFCPAYGLGEATLMVSFCGVRNAPQALQLDAAVLERNEVFVCADSCANADDRVVRNGLRGYRRADC